MGILWIRYMGNRGAADPHIRQRQTPWQEVDRSAGILSTRGADRPQSGSFRAAFKTAFDSDVALCSNLTGPPRAHRAPPRGNWRPNPRRFLPGLLHNQPRGACGEVARLGGETEKRSRPAAHLCPQGVRLGRRCDLSNRLLSSLCQQEAAVES